MPSLSSARVAEANDTRRYGQVLLVSGPQQWQKRPAHICPLNQRLCFIDSLLRIYRQQVASSATLAPGTACELTCNLAGATSSLIFVKLASHEDMNSRAMQREQFTCSLLGNSHQYTNRHACCDDDTNLLPRIPRGAYVGAPGTRTTPESLRASRMERASGMPSRRSHRNMPAAGACHSARPTRWRSAAAWITAARCAYSACIVLTCASKPSGPQPSSISATTTCNTENTVLKSVFAEVSGRCLTVKDHDRNLKSMDREMPISSAITLACLEL
jgi:hypothetical protein